MGVIERVIKAGPEPVFQADGYRIQINAGTETHFSGALKNLSEAGPNVRLKFEGERNPEGLLVAAHATFYPPHSEKAHRPVKATDAISQQAIDPVPSTESIVDADGNFKSAHTKVRLSDAGGPCGWHRVPPEGPLQQRVRAIGWRLVPEYQKLLPADDTSRIDFRFYAVDEKKIRSVLVCNPGLILVPRAVVERLQRDDQLAAVIADGVAFNLEWQMAKWAAASRYMTAAEIADLALLLTGPVAYYAVNDVGAAVVGNLLAKKYMEERGREALALLADAGYDPWQAPEAWRLLRPKVLPADSTTLKPGSLEKYQRQILDLQYPRATTPTASSK